MGQNKWRYSKKNPYLEQNVTLLERGSRKPNPLIQNVAHRTNLYYSKIYSKENTRFPLEREKNMTSQTPSSTLHFDEWTRYFRH